MAAVAARRLADPHLLPLVAARLASGAAASPWRRPGPGRLGGDPDAATAWVVEALGGAAGPTASTSPWACAICPEKESRGAAGCGRERPRVPGPLPRRRVAAAPGGHHPTDITLHPGIFSDLVAGAEQEPTAEHRVHTRAAAALRRLSAMRGGAAAAQSGQLQVICGGRESTSLSSCTCSEPVRPTTPPRRLRPPGCPS